MVANLKLLSVLFLPVFMSHRATQISYQHFENCYSLAFELVLQNHSHGILPQL